MFKTNIFRFLIVIVFLSLIFAPNVSAQSSVQHEINAIQEDINKEFADIFSADNPQDKMMVIIGEQVNGVEKLVIEIIKKRVKKPELTPLVVKYESNEVLEEAEQTSKVIFLIGGPAQNSITKEFVKQGFVQIPQLDKSKALVLARGKNKKDTKVVVLSDLRGFNNIERESARLSPLAKFMPVKYVPVAASLIGVLLVYLTKFLKVYGGKYITSIGKKSAEVKEQYLGFMINHLHIKVREYLAILIGASIYGLAIALSYTGLQSTMLKTFQITLLSCLIIFGVKESIRFVMSYFTKIHAEFVFWVSGGVIALLSGYLGNTMNTVAYIIEFKDKHFSFEKLTKIKYIVVLITFFLGTTFFLMNLLFPAKLYQMIMASATTSGMAEMFPFKPLGGKDIKVWKPRVWYLTFIIMVVSYVMINFVI